MAEVKKYTVTEPYLDLHCKLGEGPFYDQARNTLRLVDIVGKKVHTINLSEGPSSHREFNVEHSIATTANIEGNDDEFVFGGKLGYGIMNKDTGNVRWIKKMWTDAEREDDGGGKPGVGRNREERMRSNDGAVDPLGRFYVGAMNDDALVGSNFTDEGILFRLDSDLILHRVLENITIPNGTSWSKDAKTMYFTDSPTQTITAYPYDAETGEVAFSQGKVFFKTEEGVPDGHCQDEEGCLWVANHGTGKVFRVNPQGQTIAEIQLPTRCVTCPVFCGSELFITTMHEVEPEKYPESTRLQGALFKVDVGVRGRPMNKFKMTTKA
jgi:sugar lactone lactonase YvrE